MKKHGYFSGCLGFCDEDENKSVIFSNFCLSIGNFCHCGGSCAGCGKVDTRQKLIHHFEGGADASGIAKLVCGCGYGIKHWPRPLESLVGTMPSASAFAAR
jgi:hypothetical protein